MIEYRYAIYVDGAFEGYQWGISEEEAIMKYLSYHLIVRGTVRAYFCPIQ